MPAPPIPGMPKPPMPPPAPPAMAAQGFDGVLLLDVDVLDEVFDGEDDVCLVEELLLLGDPHGLGMAAPVDPSNVLEVLLLLEVVVELPPN